MVLALTALAVAVSLATVGAALAALQLGVLADANTVNDGKFKSEHGLIKLKTKGSVRIRDVQTSGAPAFTSGWHTHPGPVIVAMTATSAGTLTLYDAKCHGTTLSANQAYIETPNEPVLARNESAANAEWVTTMIVPIGVPFTNPLAVGPCTP